MDTGEKMKVWKEKNPRIFEEMKVLIEKIHRANQAYYMEDREIMSNHAYDALYDELLALEETYKMVLENSPTKEVGAAEIVSKLDKVAHEEAILSLDKTKDLDILKNFLGDQRGLLSWKLDGLTVVLTYRDGKLLQAVTRGNGIIGEDITHNAKVFVNLPQQIDYRHPLTVRGEAMISFSQFKQINDALEGEAAYKNPRNLSSGTVRQLNNQVVQARKVHFFAFQMTQQGEEASFNDSKEAEFMFLEQLGFEVVGYKVVTQENIEATVANFESRIKQEDFGSDGLVLTFDSISFSRSLGSTSKFPKDSKAFKWADEIVETSLKSVLWNTARTGLINPVAIFEAVELEGSVVSRASLHNVSIFESLKLGAGDIIQVYKANMIIPQVAENLSKSGTLQVPTFCPSCQEKAFIEEVGTVKTLFCRNIHCQAQKLHRIDHFAARDAMDIAGLSEQTIDKFIKAGFLDTYLDIFTLETHEREILEMEGFGERSFANLMDSINTAKKVPFYRFLYGLGIAHVGLATARLIAEYFDHDPEKVLEATEEMLLEVDGVGEVIAKSFSDFWATTENKEMAGRALSILDLEIMKKPTGNKLKGFTFVITGSLETFDNRKALENFIGEQGGKTTSKISTKTSYLINNDLESTSSKNKEASEKNIPIISETIFLKKLESQTFI